MDLNNDQIEQIARTILPDIHQYIAEHQNEYNNFKEAEVKKNELQEKRKI